MIECSGSFWTHESSAPWSSLWVCWGKLLHNNFGGYWLLQMVHGTMTSLNLPSCKNDQAHAIALLWVSGPPNAFISSLARDGSPYPEAMKSPIYAHHSTESDQLDQRYPGNHHQCLNHNFLDHDNIWWTKLNFLECNSSKLHSFIEADIHFPSNHPPFPFSCAFHETNDSRRCKSGWSWTFRERGQGIHRTLEARRLFMKRYCTRISGWVTLRTCELKGLVELSSLMTWRTL
jgi:hypothetical protein